MRKDGKSYKINEPVIKNELSKEELDSLEKLLGPEKFKEHLKFINSIEDTFSVKGSNKIKFKKK
ncbi:hypothetical protein [Flammeovirga pacifica]|nr:hypothetical protein [Flammeovirga pacifica]